MTDAAATTRALPTYHGVDALDGALVALGSPCGVLVPRRAIGARASAWSVRRALPRRLHRLAGINGSGQLVTGSSSPAVNL